MANNKNNKKYPSWILAILVVFLFGSLSLPALAYNYTPMEPIPGFSANDIKDFPNYVLAIYKFGIWTVGIAALLMITIGGFFYMTSAGNTSRAGIGKQIIFDAILGLVIALTAWLILYVINPNLVSISLDLSALEVNGNGTSATNAPSGNANEPGGNASEPGGNTADETNADHERILALLNAAGVGVSASGTVGCGNGNDCRTCTCLAGLPDSAVNNLISLKNGTGCAVTVTGGTEPGHRSHGEGKAAVDLGENTCLESALGQANNRSAYNISKICADANSQSLCYNCCGYTESNPHYHVQF